VGLVGQDQVRAGAEPAGAQARNADAVQHGLQLWAVAPLPGGQEHRQHSVALLAGQVHLGAQATAGPPQRVVGRLRRTHPGRRFGLSIPLFRAPAAC
jgi:hypothetical protein